MRWANKYRRVTKEYFRLTERYELRFEYINGNISLRDGTTVLLLGEIAAETQPDTALVVISDVTEEEAAQLAEFMASLRNKE